LTAYGGKLARTLGVPANSVPKLGLADVVARRLSRDSVEHLSRVPVDLRQFAAVGAA